MLVSLSLLYRLIDSESMRKPEDFKEFKNFKPTSFRCLFEVSSIRLIKLSILLNKCYVEMCCVFINLADLEYMLYVCMLNFFRSKARAYFVIEIEAFR